MKGCEDGPDEGFRVLGVLHVHSTFFIAQPFRGFNVTRAMKGTVLSDGNDEFRDAI